MSSSSSGTPVTKNPVIKNPTEFVFLMAALTALLALSIDMILPALDNISRDFALENPNIRQTMVSMLFAGMMVGTLLFGTLCDSIGRKPSIYIGLTIFVIGSATCMTATSFDMMIIGRLLQGLGVAAPRVVSIAIVRDSFRGAEMARVMSIIMTIFIFVPIIAPSLGSVILLYAPWQIFFAIFIGLGVMCGIWLALRQPETLVNPLPLRVAPLLIALREIVTQRTTMCYSMCSGLMFATLTAYIMSAQQIFYDIFDEPQLFTLYFGISAAFAAAASFTNSKLVQKYPIEIIGYRAIQLLLVWSVIFSVVVWYGNGATSLILWMIFISVAMFLVALTFGNFNTIALAPLGHIAGTATSIISSLTTLISIVCGSIAGQLYSGTLFPIMIMFCVASLATVAIIFVDKRYTQQSQQSKIQ